jgi:dihydropteroate synthase
MPDTWRIRRGAIILERPLIMGVLNVTPDSFSDAGRHATTDAAIAHGRSLIAAGADVIDVGGESTRPGAEPVDRDEELRRVLPVVEVLAGEGHLISIDTMKPEVAAAALAVGAEIVNDVGGMGDPDMRNLAAEHEAGVVIMHMRGTPRTMQIDPRYDDVVGEIARFLEDRCELSVSAGVRRDAIVVDPGIGFGKTVAHNLEILGRLGELCASGRPVLVGSSRKKFLGVLTGAERPEDRDLASAVAAGLAIGRGAAAVRVHDVAKALEAAQVAWAIVRGDAAPWEPLAVEGVDGG